MTAEVTLNVNGNDYSLAIKLKPKIDGVDRATAEVFRGAEGKALYERWFLQPIPPRGLTLNVPMSPALARSYAAPSDAADPAHYGS